MGRGSWGGGSGKGEDLETMQECRWGQTGLMGTGLSVRQTHSPELTC